MGRPAVEEAGNVYGLLTVLSRGGMASGGKAMWLCRCECGVVKEIAGSALRERRTVSCGCHRIKESKRTVKLLHKWYEENNIGKEAATHYRRMTKIKSRYGLDEVTMRSLMDNQKGCCSICKQSLVYPSSYTTSMCIDHDHSTGKVRGLLCRSCNLMIGYAYDSEVILQCGIDYLKGAKV